MALREYQENIALDTLYEVRLLAPVQGAEQINPSLTIEGGSVDIYVSQPLDATPPTNMILADIDIAGVFPLGIIPNYIYLTENAPTVTTITASGLNITPVV